VNLASTLKSLSSRWALPTLKLTQKTTIHNFHGGRDMLVLTRKPGEKIQVGDDITITVLAINGGKIRLGIDAPDDVVIVRHELLELLEGVRAKLWDRQDRAKCG
jgi:carbon storage regulator